MLKWLNWRTVISSFIGGILRTIFVAICIALGFGPDKWAAFLITGMPVLVTPGVVRLVFLLFASLTLGSLLWNKISGSQPVWRKAGSIIVVCLPFVAGAFYVTANSKPIPPDRHLKESQKAELANEINKIPSERLHNIVVASVDDPEAMAFADEFVYFFRYYGIPLHEIYADNPENHVLIPYSVRQIGRVTGMSISVHDPEIPQRPLDFFGKPCKPQVFLSNIRVFMARCRQILC
jgi:hypothetical protein